MTTQHTTGPWEVCDYELGLKAISTPNITHYLATEIDAADARLIAAAPDLLAALERIAAGDPMHTSFNALAISEARAAIAKATGEA